MVHSDWADYEFDQELMPLEEVEQFITTEKHLPGIPSAQEIVATGLSVGQMQTLQMEKIEETMRHLIALNKKITALQEENEQLKAQLATFMQPANQ